MIDYNQILIEEWKKAVEWVSDCSPDDVVILADYCASDSAQDLIEWMLCDHKVADCVQRLTLLSLQQATHFWNQSLNGQEPKKGL